MGALTAHVFMLTFHSPVSLLERRVASYFMALAMVVAIAFLAAVGIIYLNVFELGLDQRLRPNSILKFLMCSSTCLYNIFCRAL